MIFSCLLNSVIGEQFQQIEWFNIFLYIPDKLSTQYYGCILSKQYNIMIDKINGCGIASIDGDNDRGDALNLGVGIPVTNSLNKLKNTVTKCA